MHRSHSHGGVVCGHATLKACNLARQIELGQCSEMIEKRGEPYPCPHWAVEQVAGRGYCGMHVGSVIRAEDERQRKAKIRAGMDSDIGRYLAWRQEHPSVWDRMPPSGQQGPLTTTPRSL